MAEKVRVGLVGTSWYAEFKGSSTQRSNRTKKETG